MASSLLGCVKKQDTWKLSIIFFSSKISIGFYLYGTPIPALESGKEHASIYTVKNVFTLIKKETLKQRQGAIYRNYFQ